jgi:uncharacterized protein (DUF2235 family)
MIITEQKLYRITIMSTPKNIVICYDGTGNEYGKNNTNVVKTFESIVRNEKQVAFYDPGVGTFSLLGRTIGRRIGIVLGKAFGAGLQKNIEDGYEYLMNRHEPGDHVFIFGFSRGAFTARALAGMIYHFWVLQKGSKNLIPYVSKMYNQGKLEIGEKFREGFCHPCKIDFIGVWDTVASLGYFHGKTFYDQTLKSNVKNGFQAIAIDEKRKKFQVSLWDQNNVVENQLIEQVWFPGVHSDVGGYYTDRGLSDIAFAWMMDKAEEKGLILKENWKEKLAQNYKGKLHKSWKGPWILWKKLDRDIPCEAKIHQSVVDRMESQEDYRPVNIEDCHTNIVQNKSYSISIDGIG